MGAKKRAATEAAVEKKPKVELTQEQITLAKMLEGFDGPVGTMLSPNVLEMVKEIADKCLLPPVETRELLETKFAEAVGTALDAANDGLTKAHNDANDVVASEEEKVQNLGNGLTEAVSMKEKSDDSLAAANEAELEATGKKTDADSALKTHVEEEKTLQPKKLTMEGELQACGRSRRLLAGPRTRRRRRCSRCRRPSARSRRRRLSSSGSARPSASRR
jgi:hypothetical protein